MEETLSPSGPVNSKHVKPCVVNVSDTIQKWIAIIETTGHEQLQVILHYPDQGDGEYAADPAFGKSMSYRLLIYVSGR